VVSFFHMVRASFFPHTHQHEVCHFLLILLCFLLFKAFRSCWTEDRKLFLKIKT